MVIILAGLIMLSGKRLFSGANSDNNKSTANEAAVTDQSGGETASSVPLLEKANASAAFDASKKLFTLEILASMLIIKLPLIR